MSVDYSKYLRLNKMPTQWCWGCGYGVILKSLINVIDSMGWDSKDVCIVAGIGCSGRFSSYLNFNTVHTTHGRALAYSTGIKLTHPDKQVICITGDGDGLAIGGNHTIHAARRNIGVKHILLNNFIYGLTNSQTSPTTPLGMWTATANYGNVDPSFDASKLLLGAGATFVARETVLDTKKIEKTLKAAFDHDGYAFTEILSNCHINLGRKNKMGEAVQTLDWIRNKVVPNSKFAELSDSEKATKMPTGILRETNDKLEYCKSYDKVIKAATTGVKVTDL